MDADVEGALRSGLAVTVRSLAATRSVSLPDARAALARNAAHYAAGCALLVSATPSHSGSETRLGLERIPAAELDAPRATRLYALAPMDADARAAVQTNAALLFAAQRAPAPAEAAEPQAKRVDAGSGTAQAGAAQPPAKTSAAPPAKPTHKQGSLLAFFAAKKKE